MALKTKFTLGIIGIFALLAVGISIVTIVWLNSTTLEQATHRVERNINSAWLIYDDHLGMIRRLSEFLAQEVAAGGEILVPQKDDLKAYREKYDLHMLTLLDPQGRVVLRTHPPYRRGDTLAEEALVDKVLSTGESAWGTILLSPDRLQVEGVDLDELCEKCGSGSPGMFMGAAVPIIADGRMVGILEAGVLLNGSTREVDRIRNLVFENQSYKGKPLGTATIFMKDLRISTNVADSLGHRAIGTRVSREVADQVLAKGLSWTGRAWVVDAWYLSQYDPIRDPNGHVIGMLYVGELEQKYLDLRTEAIMLYLSVIGVGMALAFLVFFLIGQKSILNPVQALSIATKKLTEGDLSYRLAVETKDEVGELSTSFNRMGDQLERQRNEIQDKQQALETTNEELRTTNRNYMDMLGFVSHELRNPLSSSIMRLSTLTDGYLGALNERQVEVVEAVDRNLHYFLDMIKNYLDLSRLEKGELELKEGTVHLFSDVIVPILDGLEGERHEREMKVENGVPEDIEISADRDLLRIVYDNLLANALKYGRRGGRIVLDARQNEAETRMSVSNEGEGVPQEKMGLLFQKFSRIPHPAHQGKKGTGLGLYICKEIVEKHGGNISAESEEGEWIKFIFTFPREPNRAVDSA
jgi:two-component system, NtrC family, sensor kinase